MMKLQLYAWTNKGILVELVGRAYDAASNTCTISYYLKAWTKYTRTLKIKKKRTQDRPNISTQNKVYMYISTVTPSSDLGKYTNYST